MTKDERIVRDIKRVSLVGAVLLLLILLFAGCDVGNIALFGSPTQNSDRSPSTGPSPSPTPSPSPGGSPTPSPSPSPVPTPIKVCLPAPLVPLPACSALSPIYDDILAQAMAKVVPATEVVYVTGVIAALNAMPNICAAQAIERDELLIKTAGDNSRSERWDIFNQNGYPQRLYQHSCIPAAF